MHKLREHLDIQREGICLMKLDSQVSSHFLQLKEMEYFLKTFYSKYGVQSINGWVDRPFGGVLAVFQAPVGTLYLREMAWLAYL